MRPAVCSVCGKVSNPKELGDWVEFKDYDMDQATNLSHPKGLECFCKEHIESARDLVYLDSTAALEKLKIVYPSNGVVEGNPPIKRSWLKKLLGR